MANCALFYDSSKVQSILSMNVARLKFDISGNDVEIIDTVGSNEAAVLVLIDTLTDDTMHEIAVCTITEASYTETGRMTYDQVAYLDSKLVTANKGTSVRANTCQANSTVTEIVLDSGASASNDYYNGMYIKTDGTTDVYRYISDYVGATKICTVVTTSTAVTTTETFIVYTNDHIYTIGDASSTQNACRVAWTTLFDSDNIPLLIGIMGGYGSGFKNCPLTVLTANQVGSGSLTDTSAFTAEAYDNGGYYCAILSASGGNYMVGEAVEIASNTVSVLTLKENWTVTPSGTVTYAIYFGTSVLYDKYLEYAIPTYLWDDSAANFAIFKSMLDRYGDIEKQGLTSAQTYQDVATIDDYAAKGKAIMDAVSAGVVS